jgi:hypothetical protein
MRIVTVAVLASLLAVAPGAGTLHAQQTQAQIEAMIKWGQAEDIHYDVVAEYAKDTRILIAAPNSTASGAQALVTDRYEVSFDWNPVALALIGKPVFRNFPSTFPTAAVLFAKSCRVPPPFTGVFDYVELLDSKQLGTGSLEFSAKRTYPEGLLPFLNEFGKCGLDPAPAKTESVTTGVVIVSGMYFATPQAVPANVTVLKDGKTMILKDEPNGWTYTYTLKLLK